MAKIISKNLDTPDKTWTFLDGSRRSVITLGSVAIGRGEYLPGWQWSKHVGPMAGKESQSHIGFIISGKMVIKDSDGKEMTVGPNEGFEVGLGHDAWVLGNESCIAMDLNI